jgi:hypothetical protein
MPISEGTLGPPWKWNNYGNFKKQRINTRSSTESELVGTHAVAPYMLRTRYFIEAQGYTLKESVLNQYIMITMLLETNGK